VPHASIHVRRQRGREEVRELPSGALMGIS